jgi:hypothetical protein
MDIEKKLSSLTQARKSLEENLRAGDQEIKKRIEEKIANNLIRFQGLKKDIKEACILIKRKVQPSGDDILVITNEDASSESDKARNFINIYVYPNGYEIQKYGFNAPGLYIDCDLQSGKLAVSKRIAFNTTDVKLVDAFEVSTILSEHLVEMVIDTVGEVFENVLVPTA